MCALEKRREGTDLGESLLRHSLGRLADRGQASYARVCVRAQGNLPEGENHAETKQ